MKSMVNCGNHRHDFEGILCSCGKIIHLLLYLVIRNEDVQELSQPYLQSERGIGGSFLCKLYHVPNIII